MDVPFLAPFWPGHTSHFAKPPEGHGQGARPDFHKRKIGRYLRARGSNIANQPRSKGTTHLGELP